MIAIMTKPARARTDMVTTVDPKTGEKRSTSIAANFVERLLRLGVDPAIRNRQGKTALDLARERGDTEILALLANPPKSS